MNFIFVTPIALIIELAQNTIIPIYSGIPRNFPFYPTMLIKNVTSFDQKISNHGI